MWQTFLSIVTVGVVEVSSSRCIGLDIASFVEPPILLATDSVPAAERRYSNRLPQDRLEFVPYVTSETHQLHDSVEDADQL